MLFTLQKVKYNIFQEILFFDPLPFTLKTYDFSSIFLTFLNYFSDLERKNPANFQKRKNAKFFDDSCSKNDALSNVLTLNVVQRMVCLQ